MMEEVRRDADAVRDRCRTLEGFVREAWQVLEPMTAYVPNWHQDAISAHLEAITHGEIQRLQINQPPGTRKSLTASVMWQAWEWGPMGMSGLRYLTTSYTETWARRNSRKTRDLIQSEWYRALWPDVVLTRDNETDFENTMHGVRKAMPFRSLTAGRGNRLVIDDPHSTEQAESDADREKTTRIFRKSATSRLNDPKHDAILVIMHRLHPEDLCGVIEELGLPYVKLILPMEYHRSLTVSTKWFTDPRSEENELLCPERIPRETVEQNKIELGPHAYDTQYQQLARARDGSYFFAEEQLLDQNKMPVPVPARCDAVYAIVDTALKPGKKRDGTAVTYFALIKNPKRMLVVLDWDIIQIKGSMLEVWMPAVFKRLEELAIQCGARMGSLGAWIEDKGSGTVLLQQAENKNWQTHALEGPIVEAGKEGRALSVSGYVYKGFVKISQPAYDKTTIYKGRTRNHFMWQVFGFQIGVGVSNDEDDIFDTFCYGIAIALGNEEGI